MTSTFINSKIFINFCFVLSKEYKAFQKLWPYHFTDEELEGDGSQYLRHIVRQRLQKCTGARWKVLINVGLLMGILGGVCGNYVGIGVAYLIKMILGL